MLALFKCHSKFIHYESVISKEPNDFFIGIAHKHVWIKYLGNQLTFTYVYKFKNQQELQYFEPGYAVDKTSLFTTNIYLCRWDRDYHSSAFLNGLVLMWCHVHFPLLTVKKYVCPVGWTASLSLWFCVCVFMLSCVSMLMWALPVCESVCTFH